MKLSDKTLSVLKNFATISDSLLVRKGNIQTTIDLDEVITSEAALVEQFPKDFGIYNLQQLLANITTLENPEITFEDSYLVLADKNISLKYFYSSPTLLKTLPSPGELDPVLDKPDVIFELLQDSFQKLLKIAQLNALTYIKILGVLGLLKLQAIDVSNDTSNSADVEVGPYTGSDFEAIFKVDNLNKLLPSNYKVTLKNDVMALFTNSDKTMKYFVAVELPPKKRK